MSNIKRFSIIKDNKFILICFLFLISISSFSQVGIGTTTPDASSVLDVTATDKGILIPRVSLANITTTMLDGTNTAATGLLIYNTNAGVISGNGLGYYYFNGTIWEQLSTSSTSNDHDFYEEGSTNSPNDINDDIYTHGNLAIGKTTADYPMDIYDTTATRGINIELLGADNSHRIGIQSRVTNTGDNGHTGFTNYLTVDGNGNHWGIRTQVSGSGSGWKSANMNSVHGAGTGIMIGTHNNINGTGDGLHGGTDNLIQNEGDGIQFGTRNQIINNRGHGLKYGVLNEIESTGDGDHYGNYSLLSGSGSGDKFGSYNEIESSAGGTPYGVFSKVDNFGGYAGYFLGRVSLGTATTNNYILPLSRGTANQVMQTDASGNVSWIDASTLGSDDHDWYEEGTTNSPNSINDDIYTQGNVAIGKTTADYALDIEETVANRAINVHINSNTTNYGIHVVNSSSGGTLNHGIYNDMRGGDGLKFAVRNEMTASNNSQIQGVLNNMTGSSSGSYLGINNFIDATGSGKKYGCYTRSSGIAQGDIYGVYSRVSKPGSFAGFFVGDLAIGTETENSITPDYYILPPSRGTANQVMQTDAAGNVSWVDPSSTVIHGINDLRDGKSDNDGTDNGSSVFLGWNAGAVDDSTDNHNVGVGFQSLGTNQSGSSNTAIGAYSQYFNWFADNNTALGYRALYTNSAGDNNTSLGVDSGYRVEGSGNVFLGYSSGYNELGSNKLYIENSNEDSDNALIYGEFDNNILRINGELQLGSISANRYAMPTADGTSNQLIQTNGAGQLSWVNETPVRNASNGLSINVNDIVLGGTLTQATTITQDTNNLTINLNNTGDFNIEGNSEPNLFYADGGNDRIGVLTNTPEFDIHLVQPNTFVAGSSGIGFSTGANNWKIYHSGLHFSFVENGVRRAYVTGGTGDYVVTSDRRLKKSITEVESILDKVNTLKAYRYLYKDQEFSAKKTIGFMAQDIQNLFPELVGQAEDGYFGLNYSGFGVVAIKAIQEQQVIIESQQKTIQELQDNQDETNVLLNQLLKRIENLESKKE